MIRLATILLLSVLAGLVAAAFVWFGWNLCENLLVAGMHRRKRRQRKPEPDETEEPAPAPEPKRP